MTTYCNAGLTGDLLSEQCWQITRRTCRVSIEHTTVQRLHTSEVLLQSSSTNMFLNAFSNQHVACNQIKAVHARRRARVHIWILSMSLLNMATKLLVHDRFAQGGTLV